MENPELGRMILKEIDAHPDSFTMALWGKPTACGTVACLAGHAMLLSGYTLRAENTFFRPDGTYVGVPSSEAAGLLGLTKAERFSREYPFDLFLDQEPGSAVRRLRAAVGTSEEEKS
jgi:hypothetical protein